MVDMGKESVNGSNISIPKESNDVPNPMESDVAKFDDKMKKPQLYSLHKDWRKFKQFFAKQPAEALLEPIDWVGNTAMHVATRSNDPELLRELMAIIIPVEKRREALSKGNIHGNTVLHHAIHCSEVKVLDVLLSYKDLTQEMEMEMEMIDACVGELDDQRRLLQFRNVMGETPVYRAARSGKIHMLVHLKKYYLRDEEDLHIHFPKQVPHKKCKNSDKNPENLKVSENVKDSGDSENTENSKDSRNSENQEKSILYMAIAGQYMDVAMWLISEVPGIEELANEADKDGLTCLQLLSQMPSAFRSHLDMRSVEKLIYYLLPVPRYPEHRYERYGDDDDICHTDDSINDRSQGRDIESGKYSENQPTSVLSRINHALRKFIAHVLSRINRAIWKFIADEWDEIDTIWEKKRQHRLAKKLAKELVKKDINSWWKPDNVPQVVSPVINPPNVHTRRIKATLEKTQSMGGFTGYRFNSPLHLAASTGIVEIVECIIELHPEAIAHVEEKQNILHVAVKHRQRKIYRLLKRYGALKWLAAEMSNEGRTVLHQVARMDYYNGGNRAGVVFQLQDELRWFERVKRAIPPPLILHSNKDNLKASELFDIEHEDMLKEAQDWIKGTAQSCSAVAVLVATVVFAAAYTIPGGINDNGVPVFLNSPLFLFFTIADVAALACSLVSVMMFLSILTSAFEMENFLKSLPRKLTLGFTLLFCSLTITMLAFSSTILLTVRLEKNKWSTSLIYGVTFFPVALFGLMQFPIYMAVKYRLKRVLKTCKQVLPKRFTKKAENKKYSKILY